MIIYVTDEFRKKLSVDTLQFILFLFLQNAPRSSLKTPMVAAEEYPKTCDLTCTLDVIVYLS